MTVGLTADCRADLLVNLGLFGARSEGCALDDYAIEQVAAFTSEHEREGGVTVGRLPNRLIFRGRHPLQRDQLISPTQALSVGDGLPRHGPEDAKSVADVDGHDLSVDEKAGGSCFSASPVPAA